MFGIYKISNKLNNRIYIGSTNNLQKREIDHFSKLRNNKHINKFLQYDFNKCKEENFIFETIEEYSLCSEIFLLNREQYYLNKFFDNCKLCYNINNIAFKPPSFKGKKHSQKTILKMKNRVFSDIHRKRISEKSKGKIFSDDLKKRLSEIQKIKSPSRKSIYSIEQKNGYRKINYFKSVAEAEKYYNLKRGRISSFLTKRKKFENGRINFYYAK